MQSSFAVQAPVQSTTTGVPPSVFFPHNSMVGQGQVPLSIPRSFNAPPPGFARIDPVQQPIFLPPGYARIDPVQQPTLPPVFPINMRVQVPPPPYAFNDPIVQVQPQYAAIPADPNGNVRIPIPLAMSPNRQQA